MSDFTWHPILDGRIYTDKTAAEATGYSPRTIEGWRHSGRLPYLRVGGRAVRIVGSDLADLLDSMTERVASDDEVRDEIGGAR